MLTLNSYTLRHDAGPLMGHVVSMRGRKATTPLGKWPNTVAARRRARDMTQEGLALAAGLNLKTLQKIERWGQRLMPEHQAKLAPVLGCTFEELAADPTAAPARNPIGGTRAMSTASSTEQLRKMQSAFTRRMMARWPPGVPFDPDLADELSATAGDLIDQALQSIAASLNKYSRSSLLKIARRSRNLFACLCTAAPCPGRPTDFNPLDYCDFEPRATGRCIPA